MKFGKRKIDTDAESVKNGQYLKIDFVLGIMSGDCGNALDELRNAVISHADCNTIYNRIEELRRTRYRLKLVVNLVEALGIHVDMKNPDEVERLLQ